jgi:mRNA interferase RelE/StbE
VYTLQLSRRARRDLRRLDAAIRSRVRVELDKLRENCETRQHKALKGIHGGKFSLTVAQHYRILYTFNKRDREIIVHRIGHRSSVY